jgi:hypothetical protein
MPAPPNTSSPTPLFRGKFDVSRDPLAARNALGITTAWLETAIGLFSATKVQVFTGSGTYTPTAGPPAMKFCIIECIGGGGAGGGVVGSTAVGLCGGGGGSGGYSRSRKTAAQIGASQAVTIGAGGAGSSGAVGGNGGDTSVGSLVIGKGGAGGLQGDFSTFGLGGAGGIAGTGDIAAAGNAGPCGLYYNDTVHNVQYSSNGAASAFGGAPGSVGFSAVAANAGNNANAYGAGGSGATAFFNANNAAGGNGSAGIVIITEFI